MPRYFQRLTIDQLSDIIEDAVDVCGEDRYHCWRDLTPQIKKDLSKCDFDLENVGESQTDFGPEGLMGFHTLDNGFTFKGMCAGGDWESPVFFIIYWDGKKLRAYIPKDGNPWNTTTKAPYGNDDVADGKNLKKRYPVVFDGMDPEECDHDMVYWNSDEIQRDITKRITEKE